MKSHGICVSLCDLFHIAYLVHVIANGRVSFFSRLSNIPFCPCLSHGFFIHLSVDGHSGCFRILVTVNKAAVSIGVWISFELTFAYSSGRYIGRVVVLVLMFLMTLHTIFHGGCINMQSHQRCVMDPFSPCCL